MAQYNVPDPDQLMPCPYDKVHMIAAKRMQYHLMKCRRNHPGKEFAVCPFNARHEVPKPELRYHMANCPDRARVEQMIIHEQSKRDGTYFKGNTDLPNYSHSDRVVSVENWDEEIPSVPRIGVPASHFSKLDRRDTAGLSKAQKKEYKRLIQLPPEERIPHPDDEEKFEEEEDSKLRMPHHKPQTYMGAMGQGGANPPPSSVYAYSLSMSGIGRGQQVGRGRANAFEPVGRGRGRAAGRGVLNFHGQAQINGYTSKPPITNGNAPPGLSQFGIAPYCTPSPNGMPEMANTAEEQQQANGIHHSSLGMPQYPSQSAMNVFSMGLGRGRGLTKVYEQMQNNSGVTPTFVVPTVGNIPTDKRLDDVRMKSRDSSVSSRGETNSSDEGTTLSKQELDVEAARARDCRRLEKKLRQIEMLEKKVTEGYKLTTEEEIKVENKKDIVLALEDLRV